MREKKPCPNIDCFNYGHECFNHCHNCGLAILWRPPGLDPEIKYNGPKPLNALDLTPHDRCAFGTSQYKRSGDPAIDNINYTKELAFFLHHGYPCLQSHYDRCYSLGIGLQQLCGDPNCQCARVEAQKDPLIKEEWNRQREEWLKKWEGQGNGRENQRSNE